MGETVPAGGPASVHGFLYQLLSNLSHLARARMSGDGDSLLLTLEPGATRTTHPGRVIRASTGPLHAGRA